MARPLTKQRPVRTSFDSQRVKRLQTLVKSSWEDFYHIFSSMWGEMIWKISLWFNFEIIGVFLNTYGLAIPSIVFRIVGSCRSLLKSNCLKNKKYFLRFLSHWCNLHQILNIFEKKKILTANVFPEFTTV